MRLRIVVPFVLALSFASSAFAKDVYVAIAGTVNNFHTDTRIFNPSGTKDISITATFLPVGNVDNSSRTSVTINVPKRQQKVLDDVITAVFNASGLGAVKLSCPDDFVATSRIYAITAAGTLGQFANGQTPAEALSKGVLLQLKSNASYRTNIGAVNPNGTAANVTWRLYDKNNALIGAPKTVTMPPMAVIGPTNMASGFFFDAGNADLSDAWVSFVSDQPVFAYSSVLDNGTTDGTLIPASPDTGTAVVTPPTTDEGKVFTVLTKDFEISITPALTDLAPGDKVTFKLTGQDRQHGFEVVDPTGAPLINTTASPGQAQQSFTITLTKQGTYGYFCTITTCGPGHGSMGGTFDVGNGTIDDPGRPGY